MPYYWRVPPESGSVVVHRVRPRRWACHAGLAPGPRAGSPARWRIISLILATLLGATACGSPGRSAAQADLAYPAGLWPQRPVVELTFDLAPDLSSAAGRERIVFTPDAPVCELVFRAWPNAPVLANQGTALLVTAATVDGRTTPPRVLPAGAPPEAPGTLIELPLPECVPPGQPVSADLAFTLTFGSDVGDRIGFSGDPPMAWFATGFPLLAWVRGQGWARDDAMAIPGEFATSETFDLRSLTVNAPSEFSVLGTGAATGATPGAAPGTTSHRFTAGAVRDVAVSAGRFDVWHTEVNSVRIHLGTPATGTRVPPRVWLDRIAQDMQFLSGLFGPFPYRDLWVSVIPAQGSGLEFPTALQFGDIGQDDLPSLVAHELSHQWFYALVGNNQAADPWLDEAFATYGGVVATNGEAGYALAAVTQDRRGDMGRPMRYWNEQGDFDGYVQSVYTQGGAVLVEARRRAGAIRFDAALRAYVAANAHQIAQPGDVARDFRELPEVRGLLVEYGALPPGS
ncbi:MAG: hypothetical protein AVDCRST_MAG54-35 [uncultured Actinomycetospora sp.]|uniref:Peptidase M1 membrane alanine aminopeptidase domain-containing protein n=1 Tax=uncultured Actinomycetospora sp. TaxID=1135996 RepID=A0A6J4GYZ4_9PSEU|nr:MAG: hypothetical protein AVDCRST_MAG54-35 [uncultured Actinomycetospora sp.]